MAFADYFAKNVLAINQLLGGFDRDRLEATLRPITVGIAFDKQSYSSPEGSAVLDLLVRLFARFYPTLSIRGPVDEATKLQQLARRINPLIEIANIATIEVIVGTDVSRQSVPTIFAGSNGWNASVNMSVPQAVHSSSNRFGAGAAACLAASAVFRQIFLPSQTPDEDITFSCFTGDRGFAAGPDLANAHVPDAVLVGCGAIGNGFVWALSGTSGEIHLIDPQTVELSNLQRYVLAERADENRSKVDIARAFLGQQWVVHEYPMSWAEFTDAHGYGWKNVLVALDSARDRRSVQGSLPFWIANAWTQTGDLGVSVHDFLNGACLSCLYLPTEKANNEDMIVAQALGVPERAREIRDLLARQRPAGNDLLDLIAERLHVDRALLDPFSTRPIRSLYVEGLCGGAILSPTSLGSADREMQVPLAHQSAMAGILLAAALLKRQLAPGIGTTITRINLMRQLGSDLTQPAKKGDSCRCVCQDDDYVSAYTRKYNIRRSSRTRRSTQQESPAANA